jgi:single-stranded-DNA-specific exonuclease
MHSHKILKIAPSDIQLQDSFSKELGISRIVSQVLLNRGIYTVEEAGEFLRADTAQLLDPYSFFEMPKTVRLIKKAAQNKERVMLFGDYDVDGLTSLALFKGVLSGLGIETIHQLPHRTKEGYGLSKNILRIALENKVQLLITADCGISDYKQVKELRQHGIEVIITDHHEPANRELPPASSIINPKIEESGYRYKDLAGVGVAYKVCQAISKENLFEELDLVSLGTIADVVPLLGENRVIAKEGLLRLSRTKRPGLRVLMENNRIKDKKITSTFVNFILGPRLNASGRMDTAETSLSLLLAQEDAEAQRLAGIVEGHNRQRQKVENKIMEEAQDLIDREINFKEHKIIVIAKEDWHQGVLGIIASKLADRFYRPAIVISLTDRLCKGSGRSIRNFHLFDALRDCKDLLESFGGHSHAAGLVLTRENIDDFRKNINHLASQRLRLEDLLPSIDIDMELGLADLDQRLIEQLENLEPFGTGNPEPMFYTRKLKLKGQPSVLGKDTLKFWVTDGSLTHQTIGFRMGSFLDNLIDSASFDLVYTPRMDNWQGASSMILEAKEIFFQ